MTKEQAFDAIVAKAQAGNTQMGAATTGAQFDSADLTFRVGVADIIASVPGQPGSPGHPPLDKLKRTRPTP